MAQGQLTMYEAAVSRFADAVGGESYFIPVPDLDSAFHCEPLQVVIKTNRKWFWESPKYEPVKDISLHELLIDGSPISNVTPQSHPLLTYNKSNKFSVHGKLGAKLKATLDFEAEGSDHVNVQANFGEVVKDEVDQHDLMIALQSRKLNMKDQFLKQVMQDKHKILCVIVGTAKLKSGGTLTTNTKVSGEATVSEREGAASLLDSDESITVSDRSTKSFKLGPGTALAFNICELLVRQDGSLELMMVKDCKGGFQKSDSGTGGLLSCGRG